MSDVIRRLRDALRPANSDDLWLNDAPTREQIEERLGNDEEARALLFDWSMAEFVEKYLEDERLQVAYLGQGVIGTNASPFDKGTASIRFHHASARLGGMPGMWGYVRGGMGMVSFYFCDAAREAGATVISGVPVAQIIPGEGVRLEGGERIAARTVISNADPRQTLRLLGEAADRDLAGAHRAGSHRGLHGEAQRASARAAQFHGAPRHERTAPLRTDQCAAHKRRVEGRIRGGARAANCPNILWCELYFQSVHDASVAPAGTHTMSVFAQYVPYKFAQGDWDSRRDEVRELALNSLGRFCSNIDTAVIDAQVLGPPDIETESRTDRRTHLSGRVPAALHVGQAPDSAHAYAGLLSVRRVHASGRQRDRREWTQRGDGGAEGSRARFDFSRAAALLCSAVHARHSRPQTRHPVSRPGPVLRGQWTKRPLDGDGCGRRPEHPDGVGRGAGLLLHPAGRERDGTVFAPSGRRRTLRVDARGFRQRLRLSRLMGLLDEQPSLFLRRAVFRRGIDSVRVRRARARAGRRTRFTTLPFQSCGSPSSRC